jgi:hypothetical protein
MLRLLLSALCLHQVPKELPLDGMRLEPRCDGWTIPTNTFGFLLVDSQNVEYPFATEGVSVSNPSSFDCRSFLLFFLL